MSQGKKPSYVLCGQVNLHKNTECAGSLANHIYYQMRDMDVTSPGNSFDHCQQLRPNPRREGLPRTVTEWQAQREQRGDLSEGEGMTAYDIMNSGNTNSNSKVRTRNSRGLRKPLSQGVDIPNSVSLSQGRVQPTQNPVGSMSSYEEETDDFLRRMRIECDKHNISKKTAASVLTLDASSTVNASQTGRKNLPETNATTSKTIDLGQAAPSGRKRGSPPEGFIYALQEPNVVGKKIVNISNVIQVMDTKCLEKKNPETPRAAIICSNHLNMWPISELCSRDMAVGLLKGSKLGDMYVVSLYCDQEAKRAVPPQFKKFRKLARKEKRQVLVFMDSNAHSETLWSSKSTDSRGREWENFIENDRELTISNIGDHFTFMSKRGQTIIDVTLSTPRLAERISQWGVVDSVPNSDHLSIEMILHLEGVWTPPPATWNFRSKDFKREAFTAGMEARSKKVTHSRFWDPTDLDNNGQSFIDDMTQTADETAPLTSRSTNIARAGWFDAECKRLLKRCRQIRHYLRQWTRRRRRRGLPDFPANKQKYTWEDYIDCRRAFRRRCRRVKRKHWRRFIAGVNDNETVAKLSKRLHRNASAELSCFRHPSGNRCTPAETVQQLKDTHFPKSLDRPPDRVREFMSDGVADIEDVEADFISAESVRICISSFKSHNAPGPDGLRYYPFKLLGPGALKRLVEILKASYLLGAMPECFKLVKIIFIPKPGKADYSVSKAHRPISLMNTIMKIPEKLFLWRQQDTNLIQNPLEGEQHGFVKARSCDSAITVVVSHLEHALMRDWFGAVAFLDFQGAYDALQYSSMEKALVEVGTDPHFISWYKDFFYHRKSSIDIKGIQIEIYHSQGAPQGGIGSPFLWSAVLNELIKIIKAMEGVKVIAYADDLCLMVMGPNKDECIKLLQSAVDAVMTWAKTHLLVLSPTKSETLLFTKKRHYPSIIDSAAKIKINGHPINYARGSVRYLGVWLDRNLNWNEHIKIKTQKARGLLHKLAGASGDLWGFKPLIGKYCWEGLARPVLSYGCLGWIPALMRKKTVDTQLTRVQRLGYKLMAFFRRSTPNKGLDMMFNIMPMKYHLLKTAAKSYIRTVLVAPYQWDEMRTNVTARVSHRTWMEEFLGDFELDYLRNSLDFVPLYRKWGKAFQVDMSSMNQSKASAGRPKFLADLDAYTDGSKEKNSEPERTGAGVVLMRGKKMLISKQRWAAYKYKLLAKNTVMQAEIYAIKKLCQIILEHTSGSEECWLTEDDSMDIYCDSQSAILALNSIFVQSELVGEVIDLLNEVAQKINKLTIRWIRGHQGHTGNVRADMMARRGRDDPTPPEPDSPKIGRATMKSEIDLAAKKLWRVMWNMDPTCRQTKHWFPDGPRPSFAFEILHLPRPVCSQIIHFVTGHNFLRRHQAIIEAEDLRRLEQHEGLGEDDDFHEAMEPIATCSLCGEDEESSYHIMTECQKLGTIRMSVFGKEEILPPYDNIPVYKLISYLKDVKLKSLEMRPFIEEFKATELPERMPDWAKVNDNTDSSDDELQADQRYAQAEGDKLLHQILYQKYSAKKVRTKNQTRSNRDKN